MIFYYNKNGLKLFDVERKLVHGGTYRFFICRDTTTLFKINHDNINKWETEEKQFGVDSYEKLKTRMSIIKQNIIDRQARKNKAFLMCSHYNTRI